MVTQIKGKSEGNVVKGKMGARQIREDTCRGKQSSGGWRHRSKENQRGM
jgi:hypothetical protein